MPATINFPPITQGDSWVKTFQLNDQDGNPIDLTGCKAHLQMRSTPHNVIYADLSSENAHILMGGDKGTITLALEPFDTAQLKMRDLLYDLDLTWPNGRNTTLFSGKVQIIFQITEPDMPVYGFFLDLTDIDNLGSLAILLATGFQKEAEPIPEGPVNFDFTDEENSGYFLGLAFGTAYPPVINDGLILDFTDIDNSGLLTAVINGKYKAETVSLPSDGSLDFTDIDNSGLIAAVLNGRYKPYIDPLPLDFTNVENSGLLSIL